MSVCLSSAAEQARFHLARFLHHERCFWSLESQEATLASLSTSFVPRLLQALIRLRITQGFIFANSTIWEGIHTLTREFTLASGASMLVQTVLFAQAEEEIDLDEDEAFESDSSENESLEYPDEDTDYNQKRILVTETWIEPQEGNIKTSDPNETFNGLDHGRVVTALFKTDEEVVRSWLTLEVLCSLCRQALEIQAEIREEEEAIEDSNVEPATKSRYGPWAGGVVFPVFLPHSSKPVDMDHLLGNNRVVPFSTDLVGLLRKSCMNEVLFSTFIQEISVEEESMSLNSKGGSGSSANSASGTFRHFSSDVDRANDRLVETVHAEIAKMHDREVILTEDELFAITGFLRGSDSTLHTSSGPLDKKKSAPKWKCYLKLVAHNSVLVTIAPATFQDTKRLLLEKTAFEGRNRRAFFPIRRKDDQQHKDDSARSSNAGDAEATRRQLLRKRTKSIDNSDATRLREETIPSERNRCRSMECAAPTLTTNTSSNTQARQCSDTATVAASNEAAPAVPKPTLRQRTHTYSHVMPRGRGRSMSKDPQPSLSLPKLQRKRKEKKVHGSLTLPLYCFEVHEANLARVILDDQPVAKLRTLQLFLNQEQSEDEDQYRHRLRSQMPSKQSVPRDGSMNAITSAHLEILQKCYYKAFVHVLFIMLQHSIGDGMENEAGSNSEKAECISNVVSPHIVHSLDVQHAIDFCDDEKVFETELTHFFRTVCGHRKESNSVVNLFAMSEGTSCARDDPNHVNMDKKFRDLLHRAFQRVPNYRDLFFYRPNTSVSGYEFLSSSRQQNGAFPRQRRDTKDTTSSSIQDDDFIQFSQKAEDTRSSSFSEVAAGVSRGRFDSISMASNRQSSEPSDFNDSMDDFEDAVGPPLFLQISLTVNYDSEHHLCIPISKFISCYTDFFSILRKYHEVFSDQQVDLEKLQVAIDVLSISLPADTENLQPLDLTAFEGARLDSTSSMTRPIEHVNLPVTHSRESLTGTESNNLTENQKVFVESLVSEIRWMVSDELVFAKTKTKQDFITEDTLNDVVQHLEQSVNKPGCSAQSIRLNFVCGSESFARFSHLLLEELHLDHLEMISAGALFYWRQEQSLYSSFEQSLGGSGTLTEHRPESSNSSGSVGESEEAGDFPDFWLIMSLQPEKVMLYFHFREAQLDKVIPWRRAKNQIIRQIYGTLKLVNQEMLLSDLHKSRACNRLLEAETASEEWDNHSDEEDDAVLAANLNLMYNPGEFACPQAWQYRFEVHPRLADGSASKAMAAMRLAMSVLVVTNRKNMYVCQDIARNIFYMRLNASQEEELPQTPSADADESGDSAAFLSRTSSIGSTPGSRLQLSHQQRALDTPSSTTTALAESGPKKELVVLLVHGLQPPAETITEELIQMLQSKLDEKVVEQLSTLLLRNPFTRLTPDDVKFLQPPGASGSSAVAFGIHSGLRHFLEHLLYYLKQNLAISGMHPPKYASANPAAHFKEAAGDKEAAHVFLFNEISANKASRNRSVSIIVLRVDEPATSESAATETRTSLDDLGPSTELLQVTTTDIDPERHVRLHFEIWERGRSDQAQGLQQSITKAVSHSLWDLITEFRFLAMPSANTAEKEDGDTAQREHILLNKGYETNMASWLETGISLGVPSTTRSSLALATRFDHGLLVRELSAYLRIALPGMETQVFQRHTVTHTFSIEDDKDAYYGLVNGEIEDERGQGLLNRHFLIVSKFYASNSSEESLPKAMEGALLHQPRAPVRHAVKSPNVSVSGSLATSQDPGTPSQELSKHSLSLPTSSSGFVPRHCLIIITFNPKAVDLITYNLSKSHFERLVKREHSVSYWLSARMSMMTSVTCQKAGIFFNQKFLRPKKDGSGSKLMLQLENLIRYPVPPENKDHLRQRRKKISETAFGSAYRDLKPEEPLQEVEARDRERREGLELRWRMRPPPDLIQRHGQQLLKMIVKNGLDIQNRLFQFWQDRGVSVSDEMDLVHEEDFRRSGFSLLSENVMAHFKQLSRVNHFCLTPLLFLPKWRFEAHATRLKCESTMSERNGRTLRRQAQDERDHRSLVQNYIQEYVQYVQTFGFVVINVRDGDDSTPIHSSPINVRKAPQKRVQSPKRLRFADQVSAHPRKPKLRQRVYLQKTLPGGLLLFEMGIIEPFFFTRLHALELTRLQPKKMRFSLEGSAQNLVDECDKMKRLLHLHSFTFDYHLRSLHTFLGSSSSIGVRQGYHFASFLSDFLKYYPKGPNFARNALAEGHMVFSSSQVSTITATQLFNYLLSNERAYNLRVVRMEPLYEPLSEDNFSCEYGLVKQVTSRIQVQIDPEDDEATSEAKIEEFDISLFIWGGSQQDREEQMASARSERDLHLHYFLILTNKRELYPRWEGSTDTNGKFATVLQVVKNQVLAQGFPSKSRQGSRMTFEVQPTFEMVDDTVVDTTALIGHEPVYYVGYFSSHEQAIQTLLRRQLETQESELRVLLEKASMACRRDHLWNRLFSDSESLTLEELRELLSMVLINNMDHQHHLNLPRRLRRFNERASVQWLQSLVASVLTAWPRHHTVKSEDGLKEYHLVMEQGLLSACLLVTLDLGIQEVSLELVTRDRECDPFEYREAGADLIKRVLRTMTYFMWSDL